MKCPNCRCIVPNNVSRCTHIADMTLCREVPKL